MTRGDRELLLGEQRDDQVVLVVSGRGDHHVDLGHAGRLERRDLARVGDQPANVDVGLEPSHLFGVHLEDEYVMAVLLEVRGDGHADAATAGDRNLHSCALAVTARTNGAGGASRAAERGEVLLHHHEMKQVAVLPDQPTGVRAYIEHRLDQRPGVKKLYYIGPDVPPRASSEGRYRQFFQIGAEAIGSESPMVDAEVIEMVVGEFASRGAGDFNLLSIRWATTMPAAYLDLLREELEDVAPTHVRGLPAPRGRPILCACWIAKCPMTSRSSTPCPRSSIISATNAAPISTPSS